MLGNDARLRGDSAGELDWAKRSLEQRSAWAHEEHASPVELVAVAKQYLQAELEGLRDTTRALECLRLAVQRAPSVAVPRLWLARALRADGQTELALATAREGLKMIPEPVEPSQQKLAGLLEALIDELEAAAK